MLGGKDSQVMTKAVFLDRDGVINELVYYAEHGIVDSPFTTKQFKLVPGVCEAINKFHELGFKVIIVSNQPGIAKGYFSEETFDKIRKKMNDELAKKGASFDGEYYCFHHPEAKAERLKVNCECRKPKPGLLLQAAQDLDIDLSQSWMIGDGLTDVKAGKSAGCPTILLGKMKCEFCHLMDEQDAHPDFIAPNLLEAANLVKSRKTQRTQATQQTK
jgi:D-glycero-D-manno-heptose 1,7-bisphosphate phosphatase